MKRQPLPVDTLLPQVMAHLGDHTGLIVQAAPGAGKSTRLPVALLDAPWAANKKILLLQPRRMAARNVASFMSAERGEPVGQTIGYRTRFEHRVSARTRLEVMTQRIFIQRVLDDPSLDDVAAVVLDEFHERHVDGDLALALLRDLSGVFRDDLRVIVMSATLDMAALQAHTGWQCFSSAGKSYPVDTRYLPPPSANAWQHHVLATINQAHDVTDKGVLVFLPRVADLHRMQQGLADRGITRVALLYGAQQAEQQQDVITGVANGDYRIVLATNVAETSVTLDGIEVVIDSGLVRQPHYDPYHQRSRLITRRISRASADQRAGRAGRTAPGQCWRLWPETERLAEHDAPQIRQVALDTLVLDLARWGCLSPEALDWLTPPPTRGWQLAQARLQQLAAIDEKGGLTAAGRSMASMGTSPMLAALLLAGKQQGCAQQAAWLTLLLENPPRAGRTGVDALVHLATMRSSASSRDPRYSLIDRWSGGHPDRSEGVSLAMVAASVMPHCIARQRPGQPGRYQLVGGPGVVLADNDPLRDCATLLVLDTDGQPRDARIRLALALDDDQWQTLCERHSEQISGAEWQPRLHRISAWMARRMGAVVFDHQPLPRPSQALLCRALLDAAKEDMQRLPWDDNARQWQARVKLMAGLYADESWPEVDDDALASTCEDWLAPFLPQTAAHADFSALPLLTALQSLLTGAQHRQLQQRLPPRITLAVGAEQRLDYLQGPSPVLAVKLQALLGCKALPRLADGRCAILTHLLSPAGRPVAVTDDLARFWQIGYPQVRKELRGRYPKHPWPEDPLAASPTFATNKKQPQK